MKSERIEVLLQEKYNVLLNMFQSSSLNGSNEIDFIIKNSICDFVQRCRRPAIWCYGKHTKMLMADFMFELKKVRYIIDNGIIDSEDSGFEIIREERIADKGIDGIIISSKIYRDEIIDVLKDKYPGIPYLDIYQALERKGIYLEKSYYVAYNAHPYKRYSSLNKMQRHVAEETDIQTCRRELENIIQQYIEIKDFLSAIKYTEKMIALYDNAWEKTILEQLNEIYILQIEALKKIDENNVLMLCIDGLRRKEVCERYMPNLYSFIKNNTYYFDHAYSVSTSTYESLIPTYSENDDLRTHYFETNELGQNQCRFINEAKKQDRNIFFYTGKTEFIQEAVIVRRPQSQTVTEKIWDFTLDAADGKNGLFYIHVLYESHYSYPNPYTKEEIVAAGTNIMFDYLAHNGGQIRTDYNRQQKDSLRYLDDVIEPMIENLRCRMVVFADHGNILIDQGTDIENVEAAKYTFHEDLIQVPFAIKSPEMGIGINKSICSIMEINNVIIGLMNRELISFEKQDYIKVQRSEIYNPDFKYLYKNTGNEHGLLAFEVFIFEEGYKLAIYADGVTELYLTETDLEMVDVLLKRRLLDRVKNRITVCTWDQIG